MKGVMTHYQTSLQLIVSFEMYVNELHELSHVVFLVTLATCTITFKLKET